MGPLWNGREFSDTLTVTLDATHADSIARAQGIVADSVIEATVMCLRINAGRSVFPAGIPDATNQGKYLRLRVLGPARTLRYARTYRIAPLPLPKRTYDRVTFARITSDDERFFHDPKWAVMKEQDWQALGLPPRE